MLLYQFHYIDVIYFYHWKMYKYFSMFHEASIQNGIQWVLTIFITRQDTNKLRMGGKCYVWITIG